MDAKVVTTLEKLDGECNIRQTFNSLDIFQGAERDAKAGLELEEQLAKRKEDKKVKREEVVEGTGEEYTTRTQVEETNVEGEEYDKTTTEDK